MPAVAAAPLFWGAVATAGATAATGAYAAHRQSESASEATAAQQTATDRALRYQEAQAARDQRNFEATQKQNLDIYKDETGYNRSQDALALSLANENRAYTREQEAQRQARVAPYAGMGLAALAQLRQPISQRGTLVDLMQRRGGQ